MNTVGTTSPLFPGLPQWYGLKGERYTEELRLLSVQENEVNAVYHRRWSYNFISAGGFRFLLYTNTEPRGNRDETLVVGADYVTVFTVKEHRKRHITRIERPTFRRIEDGHA